MSHPAEAGGYGHRARIACMQGGGFLLDARTHRGHPAAINPYHTENDMPAAACVSTQCREIASESAVSRFLDPIDASLRNGSA